MKVLVFGSLNIDYNYGVNHFVKKGETLLSDSLSVFSGGKGLNQAIALARAGAQTFQAGCIGQDGMFLMELLEETGVETKHIDVRSDVRTGNAIIQNDRGGDNCILLYGGANQAITRQHIDAVFTEFEKGDFLVLQNEINEMSYIIESARKKQMTIVLNPSPMDEKLRQYPLEEIDYFILNEIEAKQLLGEETANSDSRTAVEALHNKFPHARIVLTLGSDGSLYKDESQLFEQKCYKVQTIDTTAAGDTYTGYLIASIIRGTSVKDSMDLAARASAIAVGKKGAAPSIPGYEEVIHHKFD